MKRQQAEIMLEINNVYAALSPENLTHDGELPNYLVVREERKLTSKLTALFVELGREVSEEESWDFYRQSRGVR